MGNFKSKSNLKRYKKIEDLSLIEHDENIINDLELKVHDNQQKIKEFNSKLNDFNTNVSTNFNLVQNDLKALYQEVVILKNTTSNIRNNNYTHSIPSLPTVNSSFNGDHLFSSIQSEKEFDNHQSLLK